MARQWLRFSGLLVSHGIEAPAAALWQVVTTRTSRTETVGTPLGWQLGPSRASFTSHSWLAAGRWRAQGIGRSVLGWATGAVHILTVGNGGWR